MNARQPARLPVLLFTLAALLLSPQLDASRALTSAAANASAPSYLETRIRASEIEGRDLVGALGVLSAEERSGYAASSGGSAAGEHLAVLVHNGGLSRSFQTARRHLAGNRQVRRMGGPLWHLPKGRGFRSIPKTDAWGDTVQAAVTKIRAGWSDSMLSEQVIRAMNDAHAMGEHWRPPLLRKQAIGRYVHEEVKSLVRAGYFGPSVSYSHKGLDLVFQGKRYGYEILSETPYNLNLHAKRMSGSFFRFITY